MPDNDTIIPNPVESARARIRAQVEQLSKATDAEGTKGTMKESAILQAVATEEAGVIIVAAADLLRQVVHDKAGQLNARLDTLSKHIDEFTIKADQGTNRLAFWTMMLAGVTFLLVLAAFVQAWVMWSVTP